MNGGMNIESAPYTGATGYAGRPVTKAPNWHAWVVLDILFNNLSTGLFLVAAVAELVRPDSFTGLASVAYPVALVLLIADLICLVLDLGDPSRFHHMLRVWKPSSPLSFGTWCITAFAALLTPLALVSVMPGGGLEWLRRLLLIVALVPAFATAVYKGVVFSVTAQPGWREARWLGGYFSSSALVLGAAELLVLAMVLARPEAIAVLRLALGLLLAFNLVTLVLLLADLYAPLSRAHDSGRLLALGAMAVVLGLIVPLGLLALGTPLALAGTGLAILLGAVVVRFEIVRLPHLETERRKDGKTERGEDGKVA